MNVTVELTPAIGFLLSFVVFVLSGAVSWGVTKATLRFNSSAITDLKAEIPKIRDDIAQTMKIVRAALYGPDGISIYTPRRLCAEMRQECEDRFCSKLEEVKSTMKEDKKDILSIVNKNREMVIDQYQEISKFMGRVEEHMRINNERR